MPSTITAGANAALERAAMDKDRLVHRFGGLKTRVLSGIAMAAIALAATIYSPLSFYALVLLVALLMHTEWQELTRLDEGLFPKVGGLLYVGLPVWSFIALRGIESDVFPDYGPVLFVMLVVAATDIGAYFGGTFFGKTPLHRISPKKTWEGTGIGLLCAMLTAILASPLTPLPEGIGQALIIGALLSIASQIGDLFESWMKRRADLKDSGTLIPGHGGILDRVDGLVFAAPVYAAFMLI